MTYKTSSHAKTCVSGLGATIVLAAITCGSPLLAQDEEAATPPQIDTSYRKKSLSRLQRDYSNAEKNFYALFNDINTDDEFDVLCKTERSLSSRRRVQTCKAGFLRRYESNVAAGQMDQLTGQRSDAAANPAGVDEKQAILRGKISAALTENAELERAFAQLANAKKQLEMKMAER